VSHTLAIATHTKLIFQSSCSELHNTNIGLTCLLNQKTDPKITLCVQILLLLLFLLW